MRMHNGAYVSGLWRGFFAGIIVAGIMGGAGIAAMMTPGCALLGQPPENVNLELAAEEVRSFLSDFEQELHRIKAKAVADNDNEKANRIERSWLVPVRLAKTAFDFNSPDPLVRSAAADRLINEVVDQVDFGDDVAAAAVRIALKSSLRRYVAAVKAQTQ